MPRYEDLKPEYDRLWSTMTVRPDRASAARDVVETILLANNRARYESVQEETGVPWMVIAAIHNMESSLNFRAHLHNGDPLTARTVHVPRNRPQQGNPPFTWAESASDAIRMKRHNETGDWSASSCLFYLEAYNGWGYRTGAGRDTTPARRSPYLWSFSNHYEKGKYVSDGSFDRNSVSRQVGAAVILKILNQELGIEPADNAHGQYGSPISDRPMVQSGSRGEHVMELQGILRDRGYDPGPIDAVFGSRTRSAVISFQNANGLVADGIVGPRTWAALLQEGSAPTAPVQATGIRRAVLEFAIAEASKGRRHSPGNEIDTNVLDPLRPIMVRLGHLGASQTDSFYNWCAAWVTYITRNAGVPVPDLYVGYWASVALVDAWRDMGIRTGSWIRGADSSATPGDVVIYNWDNDDDTDHIGILREQIPANRRVIACEGNQGNRETIITRSYADIAGYIDIEKLNAALRGDGGGAAAKKATSKKAVAKKAAAKKASTKKVP